MLEFNPLNPARGKQRGWHPNHRDHRRLMLIDSRIAFVGGINISDTYSSAPLGRHDPTVQARLPGWRDTHVRIEGPVVAEFQKLFMATWARQRGDPLPARDYFPVLRLVGKQSAAVLPCRWI